MIRKGLLTLVIFLFCLQRTPAQSSFTLEQVMSAPFPANLTASKTGGRLAWTLAQQGRRNIWVAAAPEFHARQLTKYDTDEGQPLSDLHFSSDGNTVVYVRGEGKNAAGQSPNPTSNTGGFEQSVWSIAWAGGEPKKLDAGDSPAISASGTGAYIAYIKDHQLWLAQLNTSDKPLQIVVRGNSADPQWSPDGTQLAFVSSRTDHAFIAVYNPSNKSLRYLSPSVDSDQIPRWSPDGKFIAFIRRPAAQRDKPEGFFIAPDVAEPWAIWIADVSSASAREIWQSGKEPNDSFPDMAQDTGGGVLNWAADGRLIIASTKDGWQHLYSLSVEGKEKKIPTLLTPGNCEVEQWSFAPDKQTIVFNSNCGSSEQDIDRRHLSRVDITGGSEPVRITTGEGIEWSPVVLSDGKFIAYLGSDATHPGRPFVSPMVFDFSPRWLDSGTWPADFPADQLITPQQTIFHSGDGLELHAQLFLPTNLKPGQKRPALIFLHGGPMRQMLLGWHYMYYYSNCYAMNQYLASRGYIVRP
jgi:Tol biopolymer transport system component